MKHILFFLIVLVISSNSGIAAETLELNYKNGKTEKISVNSISKLILSNDNVKKPTITPNPVIDHTTFFFSLPKPGDVKLTITDLNGRIVRTIAVYGCTEVKNSVNWDCTTDNGLKANEGFYFVEIQSGSEKQYGKMLIIN